ncbi:MAG: glycosyltransferase [bacterium]
MTAEAWPRVSVIVAVYNGAATLRACLDSLLGLDYPADRLELVCVDNASTDATPRLLAEYGARLRVEYETRRGPAAARNCGLAVTRGEVVALTDADCTVDRTWLRELVAPLADPAVGIAGGKILSRRPCNVIEAFGDRIHDHVRALHEFSPPYVITMNWAARRAALEQVGGFNASLLRGSDVDCSYRFVAAGYRLVYAPGAVIYHRNERTPWGLVHEGYVHAVHAPAVRAANAELLSRLRSQRRAAVPPPPGAKPSAPHWSDPLWWALFRFGKRLGSAHAGWLAR